MPTRSNKKSSLEELDELVSAASAHRRKLDSREGQLYFPNFPRYQYHSEISGAKPHCASKRAAPSLRLGVVQGVVGAL